MKFNTRQLLIALGILLIVGLTTILISNPPKIEDTSPKHEQTNIDINQEITLTFTEKIEIKDIKIDSEPEEDWQKIQDLTNQLILKHEKPFHNNTDYTIYIFHKNKLIYTFDFKTTNLVQSNPRAVQELQESVELNYPLALQTPHITSFYEVVYSAPLTLEIQIVEFSTKTREEIISEVKWWVQSEGIDPESHQYITVYPDDIPTSTLKITQ